MAFIAVAFDDSAADVEPFAEGIDLPVLLDRHHVLSETLAVSNVPTVVWVDEADRIVVPNWVAFSNDLFTEFHGLESGPALDAIRTWVRTDVVPAELAVDDLAGFITLTGPVGRLPVGKRRHTESIGLHKGISIAHDGVDF